MQRDSPDSSFIISSHRRVRPMSRLKPPRPVVQCVRAVRRLVLRADHLCYDLDLHRPAVNISDVASP